MARKISGLVTSDAGDKTIIVSVMRRKTHPIYGKQYSVTSKFAAHDPENSAKRGDRVIISETRPISRTKTWQLDKITERGHELIEVKKESIEEELEAKKPKTDDKEATA
jgi:small subunit ribosomal protein S17